MHSFPQEEDSPQQDKLLVTTMFKPRMGRPAPQPIEFTSTGMMQHKPEVKIT